MYRLLEVGEEIRESDEWFGMAGGWTKCKGHNKVCMSSSSLPVRRKIDTKKSTLPRKGESKIKVIDRVDGTKVAHMEHFDQNESTGNSATKYIVEFTGKVNCEWLWTALDKALKEAEQSPDNAEETQHIHQHGQIKMRCAGLGKMGDCPSRTDEGLCTSDFCKWQRTSHRV